VAGLEIVVVTGMSGAGRSTALHGLEDLGFFCVDNLPPPLAPQLVEMVAQGGELGRIGLGMDVRTGASLEGAGEVLDSLTQGGHRVQVLFLDCADEALVHRFSETRRAHPLASGGDLVQAIQRERERLGPLRARADHVIDTTHRSVHDLRRTLIERVTDGGAARPMITRVVSFGFKYGLPVDADLVFDLRYLPNPHFVDALRPRTGVDREVARFVLDAPETMELLESLVPLLERVLPRYEREGKAYLTIAFGCTGGRHRSVAVAEEVSRRLGTGREVRAAHRDISRSEGT
jgi:RNase adapter protein RapZ